MSENTSIIINDDGEVLDQSMMVPYEEGATLKELVPYNRLTNIAKSTLTRLIWNKKEGTWECLIGEFDELEVKVIGASELYAVWTNQVGKPEYYGVKFPEGYNPEQVEQGYRIAFEETALGPCYTDLFGIARDFGEALCKVAARNRGGLIHIKGKRAINTVNGTLYQPKLGK